VDIFFDLFENGDESKNSSVVVYVRFELAIEGAVL